MRRALAGLWAIVALLVLLVAMTVLPPADRVPTHWSGPRPDEFTSGPGFASTILTATVLAVIVAAGTAILQRVVPAAWARWVLTVAAGIGWGAALLYAVTLWRVQMDGPEGVREFWGLVPVLGGLLAGLLAHLIHGRRRPTPEQLAQIVPERSRVQAVRGRAVSPVPAWGTSVSSPTLRVLSLVLLGVFAVVAVVVLSARESWIVLLVVLVTGALAGGLALAWSSVRVGVDADGLQVRSAVLPVRLTGVDAGEVAGVDVQELDPMRWGGVGLRALPDRTALIVGRGGPGIVVYRRDGRRLALQITEGEQVARAGARTLRQAAGQRLGETPAS